MFCGKCGTQNDDQNQVCSNCGEALVDGQNTNTNYQQPVYAPPVNPYASPMIGAQDEHVSVGKWIGIACINLIPCVGSLVYIVMLFVWAFGDTRQKSLKNYAKAQLIFLAIVVGIVIIVSIITAALGMSIFSALDSTYGYNYW